MCGQLYNDVYNVVKTFGVGLFRSTIGAGVASDRRGGGRLATGLKEIARSAGVSIKTVSNVVNGRPHVTPATRQRVMEAIAELGYRPNLSARNLRQGRTGFIGLALPQVHAPYFAELARCVIQSAEGVGWKVLVEQTDGVPERELRVLQGVGDYLSDGVIFSPLAIGPDEFRAATRQVPLVLLGERVSHGLADHVGIDNVAAARTAVEHLIGLGRRRIAALGLQAYPGAEVSRLRLEGYRAALSAAGIAEAPDLLQGVAEYTREDGLAAMASLLHLDEPPDAIFCFNDLLAVGALHLLYERGVRVPGEIAVVGFDGVPEAGFTAPSLSTVAPNMQQLADRAVALLQRRIEQGDEAEWVDLRVDYDLVVRNSTRSG